MKNLLELEYKIFPLLNNEIKEEKKYNEVKNKKNKD